MDLHIFRSECCCLLAAADGWVFETYSAGKSMMAEAVADEMLFASGTII